MRERGRRGREREEGEREREKGPGEMVDNIVCLLFEIVSFSL